MTMHVKVGGSWRAVDSPRVKVGGAWRTVQQGYVKVAGSWRTFYQAINATLPDSISEELYTSGASSASVTLVVNSNGTWETQGSMLGSGTWQGGSLNSEYEVRLSKTSGSGTTTGSAVATWLNCSTTRSWALTATVNNWSNWFGTLEIRMAASPNTVLDTASVSLLADATNV